MRTIGKSNIALVKETTRRAVLAGNTGIEVYNTVQSHCSYMHGIWESAFEEIDRIIGDNYNPHIL